MKPSRRKRLFKLFLFFLNKENFEKLYRKFIQMSHYSIWYKGIKKYDLIIFDDVLPNLSSPWRSNEFENLILKFPNSKVISNDKFKSFNNYENFKKRRSKFEKVYPSLSKKILKEWLFCNINSTVLYFLFFKNVLYYYEKININKTSYVFTLYPGGGWEFNNQTKDDLVVKIISNKLCLGVIVNQYITYDYLIHKLKLPKSKIKLIHGVPLKLGYLPNHRKFNPINGNLKIVFVGHKYTEFGDDKGLPLFLNVIKSLNKLGFGATGYIIGNFKKNNFSDYFNLMNIEFLGELSEQKLMDFLFTTDIILSPNKPFILNEGAYDGFPLGSVGVAALCGNLVLSSDYFGEGEKIGFLDQTHYLKINYDEKEIIDLIIESVKQTEKSNSIIEEAYSFLENYYSYSTQVIPRLELFNSIIRKF